MGTDHDVIIVGGRVAGSSLAARLGARGHRVLLLDRARFPSLPAVPSSSVLYTSSMPLLEELGLREDEYTATMAAAPGFYFEFCGYFQTVLEVPEMWGRRNAYGVDRASFDDMLWRNAGRHPSVERREGFAVQDLLRDDDGRVVGVVGSERDGPEQRLSARCVVGADGRFSLIARKVGAEIVEQETEHLSTVYFANWEGIEPPAEGLDGYAQIYATDRGYEFFSLPVPGGMMQLNTHERADRVHVDGDPLGYYMGRIQETPQLWRRVKHARRVGPLLGVKQIGNGYREPSGAGWVLVGDAVHYKDPIDGQGIYDALVGSSLLDRALAAWLTGERDWDTAMSEYREEFWARTHPMYVETVNRLRRELFGEPPPLVIKTLVRWMMTDPTYQRQFLSYIGRTIPPTGWNPPGLILGAAVRGLGRDLRGLVRGG